MATCRAVSSTTRGLPERVVFMELSSSATPAPVELPQIEAPIGGVDLGSAVATANAVTAE